MNVWCRTEYCDLPSIAWHAAIFFSRSCQYFVTVCQRAFSGCAFSRCHSQDVHSHAAILRMRILTLPFSGCAFSRCHSQDAHSHAAILRMRILTNSIIVNSNNKRLWIGVFSFC